MTQDAHPQPFGKWRAFFWPIRKHELKKLIPMLAIFFFLYFDYNILRCIKDTLIITAPDSGPEVIPFIKVWVMAPMSILLTWIFIRLSNRFSRETVFYIIVSSFLIFFFLFAFVLFPLREQFYLQKTADWLSLHLPTGCKGIVAMVKYWSFTLFYVMADLWSPLIMALLCWGFINQITKLEEASRFYGLLGVGINISGIAAGGFSIFVTNLVQKYSQGTHAEYWGTILLWLNSTVIISGLLALGFFAWLNRMLKNNPELNADSNRTTKKPKLSMRENIRYLLTSKYILCLVGIVVSYNIVINLVEILWKHELRALYPQPEAYNLMMNKVTIWTGILATLASFFISGNVLRTFGWTTTALITPIVLLVTSIGFFGAFFLKSYPAVVYSLLGVSPLALTVFFGTAQNCISRSCKYTVFDETKEIAFIPLPHDEKIKGKAAVDGLCTKLGKSGGSIIYQFLFLFFSTISASAPWVAIILFSIIGIWIMATKSLGKQFTTQTLAVKQSPSFPVNNQPQPAAV